MKYIKLFEEVLHEKIPIPIDVKQLSQIFTDNGYELYIVGGAIRDFITGAEPHDYDLVTNAQPQIIVRMLKDKYRLGLQGRHFAVIRVYTEETPEGIEIASYRKDIAKGRDNKEDIDNPKVEFGNHITIRDDVSRRDFTQNALYYDINREKIIDNVGGIDDIKDGIIKAVGNPRNRFKEDRLRILRCMRFAARGKLKIDKDTAIAIKSDNRLNGISEADDVSQERIIDEFYGSIDKPGMLMWATKYNDMESWMIYLDFLKDYKMYVRMFPGVHINTNFLETFNVAIIFAQLFSDNNPTNDFHDTLVQGFKLSNRVSNHVIFLLKLLNVLNDENIDQTFDMDDRVYGITSLFSKKREYEISNDTIIKFGKLVGIKDKYINAFVDYEITTNAKELMDAGITGREIGEEIRRRECEKFKEMI